MLVILISLYLIATLFIGLYASRLVKNASDFALAGRKLPVMLSASAFFATWFGAETVLGASSEFVEHGLLGVIEDPFGASLCLFLVGIFFAAPLYKLNMLSLGDLFKDRFGRKAEILSSVLMIISFFGWTAAQFIAFGLVLHFVAGVSIESGIAIGVLIVIFYTAFGGMWAVSLTDFIQTIVIILGLSIVMYQMVTKAGGIEEVTNSTPDGFLKMTPRGGYSDWMKYIAAWFTIGLGSIPSQDIFQRINATRSVRAARNSAILGGLLYLTIAFIPLIIGLCAIHIDPSLIEGDTQRFLPSVIMKYSPVWVQVFFFGALLSAILSSASAGVLAPSTILAENILRNIWPDQTDKRFLPALRLSVVVIALMCYGVTFFRSNIFELVGESSSLTLVSLFVPMMAALFIRKAPAIASIASMITGTITWGWFVYKETSIPALLPGLLVSVLTFMVVWMLLFKRGSGQLSRP
jgi:solute:Na+ symporter, SSS family